MIITINQLLPKSNDPEANFWAMEEAVKENKATGAVLSIFPEDFLYGVLRQRQQLTSAGEAFETWVSRFRALAKKYGIDLIPGTSPSYENGKIHNSAVYINSLGEVLAQYSKCNLWLAERDEYAPSLDPPEVFETMLGNTAIIICWDILDHMLFRAAVRGGVKTIICLAFWSSNQNEDLALKRGRINKKEWGYSDSNFLRNLVQLRAVEYGITMIFANFGGTHRYQGLTGEVMESKSAGQSQFTTPRHSQRDSILNSRPGILSVDINVEKLALEHREAEIGYGRRVDVANNYPYGSP